MHPRLLTLPLAITLLATACTSPGDQRTGDTPPATTLQTTAPARPAATPFTGRWKVDTAKLAAFYPGEPDAASTELPRGQQYLIDIDADGTALFRTRDGDWFIRWTTENDVLFSAEPEYQPQNVSLQVIDNRTTLVTDRGLITPRGSGGMFGRDADGNDIKPPGYPLTTDGPVTHITPADVEGEWRFSYEQTFDMIRSARDEVKTTAGRDGYSEWSTIEEELKHQLPDGPPTITIHVTNPRAARATPEAKSGDTGQVTITWGSAKQQHTFSLWHDNVVLYAKDGWHGYKPNLSFLRVVDGRVVMKWQGEPLVFERTR